MPTPEQVRAVVEGYVEAYRVADKDAVVALFAADAEFHDPVGEPPHVGHEGIATFWDQVHAMADKIVLEPKDIIVCGHEAAMVFEIHVTMGDGGMIMDGVETFDVDDDGKIRLMRAFWDMTKARPKG